MSRAGKDRRVPQGQRVCQECLVKKAGGVLQECQVHRGPEESRVLQEDLARKDCLDRPGQSDQKALAGHRAWWAHRVSPAAEESRVVPDSQVFLERTERRVHKASRAHVAPTVCPDVQERRVKMDSQALLARREIREHQDRKDLRAHLEMELELK